ALLVHPDRPASAQVGIAFRASPRTRLPTGEARQELALLGDAGLRADGGPWQIGTDLLGGVRAISRTGRTGHADETSTTPIAEGRAWALFEPDDSHRQIAIGPEATIGTRVHREGPA